MSATTLANAVLDGLSPKEFLRKVSRVDTQFPALGFRQHGYTPGLWGKSFPRPESMPTPYAWGNMVLSIHTSQVNDPRDHPMYELGLCTMGQYGVDYPDIWLGRFSAHEIADKAKAAIDLLADAEGASYDQLDRALRIAVGKPRQD